nr:MAG TPA_asm: hypothetical protein [Caudoviricetes sp.]
MQLSLPMPPGGIEARTYSYLFQTAQALNLALSRLDESNFSEDSTARQILAGGQTAEQKKETEQGLGRLRTLIIKTADAVRAEQAALELRLQSTYVALSDFGDYQEEIDTRLSATAARIEQALSYYAELSDSLHGVSEDFDAYRVDVQGYIRQGVIGYDGAVPIIGIAMGRDLRVTGAKETVDGTEYEVIDTSSNMSIWTPDKLSFYINGAEAAYFSNGALYVGTVIVKEKLVLGQDKWQITHDDGFTVRWIGG